MKLEFPEPVKEQTEPNEQMNEVHLTQSIKDCSRVFVFYFCDVRGPITDVIVTTLMKSQSEMPARAHRGGPASTW